MKENANTIKITAAPHIANISSWKPEVIEAAMKIALELGFNASLDTNDYGTPEHPLVHPVLILRSGVPGKVGSFYDTLKVAVPEYWKKEDEKK